MLLCASCTARTNRQLAIADCLGPDSVPSIDVGRVGALRLDLPLAELHRLCPNLRDTVAHGVETMDTAIVITRPNLSVVGRLGLISGGYRDEPPYRVDSTRSIYYWTVTGTAATLPGGVPLSATYDSLTRAYGRSEAFPVNGDIITRFCERLPRMTFHFKDRQYFQNPLPAKLDSLPVRLAGALITSVDFPSRQPPANVFDPCAPR